MKLKLLKLLKKLSRVSRISSRFSRFLAVFVYFSYFSSYFATTENQVLHAYKDWTGLISTDDSIISSADISSGDVLSSEDRSKDMYDMAVSNDTPASSENDNDSNDSFDSFVSHDTNDTADMADSGNTENTGESGESSEENTGNTLDPVAPVAPVASGPDEDNTPDEESEAGDGGSESVAVLTTRLTADHHLIATLSISGVMGADVAVFPSATAPNATSPDENTLSSSAGGNIYTVSNNDGSSAGSAGSYPAVSSDNVDNAEKPDSLLLNFENEEGVVESVRLWLDNEIDETVILDGITAVSDDSNTINTISTDIADFSSRAYNGTDGNNGSNNSQSDLPRLAIPLSPVLSESASSDLAAISDTNISDANISNTTGDVNTSYALDCPIDLSMIKSPIIVILPGTNEQYYFADGRALAAYDRFDQDYKISDIRATTRAEIEVRLVRK